MMHVHIHRTRMRSVRGALLGIIMLALSTIAARAGVFPVAVTGDVGPGTLRAAIMAANLSPGHDTIVFTFPGAGPHVIMPLAQLPQLSDPAGVLIDGFSHPAASPGTNPPATASLVIVIDGAQAGQVHGLVIVSAMNVIRGLVIRNFQQDGIRIQATSPGSNMNLLYCNFVGTDHLGFGMMPNGSNQLRPWAGVDIVADPTTLGIAQNNTVRGNLISGNFAMGVSISSCPPADVAFNLVDSNFIGTNITGMQALGNKHDGVYIGEAAHDNTIRHNLISGNDTDAVSIVGYVDAQVRWYTHSNVIDANVIGAAVDRTTVLPNGRHGVCIGKYGSIWLLGYAPSNTVSNNLIAWNGGDGVVVWEHGSDAANCDKNRITQNAIYNNAGLGIDLDDDGTSPNDAQDMDVGANQTLNIPTITYAVVVGSIDTVRGRVDIDTDPTRARVEVFVSTQVTGGSAQGRAFMGWTTPDAAGNWLLTGTGVLRTSDSVTATVTDLASNTSEFAAPVQVNPPLIAAAGAYFGRVAIGSSVTLPVQLHNVGHSPLMIMSVTSSTTEYVLPVLVLPFFIPAQDSVAVQVTFSPAVIGPRAGSLHITSSAQNAPQLALALAGDGIAAQPKLAVTPASLVFARTSPGGSAQMTLHVQNTGTAPLLFTCQCLSGGDSTQFAVVQYSAMQLAAGARDSLHIQHVPMQLGLHASRLVLASNDPVTPVLSVPLSAICATSDGPAMLLSRTSIAFGYVAVGSSRQETLRVTSTGAQALALQQQVLHGTDASSYSLVATASTPLATGTASDVVIRLSPASPGVKSAFFRIVSNDPTQSLVDIPLNGSTVGIDPRAAVDELVLHVQPSPIRTHGLFTACVPPGTSTTLHISDLLGRHICTREARADADGIVRILWHRMTDAGVRPPSGIYCCVLVTGSQRTMRSIVLR